MLSTSSGSGKRVGSSSSMELIVHVLTRLPLALKPFTEINCSASISKASRNSSLPPNVTLKSGYTVSVRMINLLFGLSPRTIETL